MARGYLNTVLDHVRRLTGAGRADGLSDGCLLERFVAGQDEAAFAALLERHGPMVLGVCRRHLPNPADAEDAFQATFLVLVSRAGQIHRHESVGSWLHGVAYRTAHRARHQDGRRRRLECPPEELPAPPAEEPGASLDRRELRAALDEELRRLPPRYQAPLVLCYLQGRTNAEAAAQLGWPLGTVQVRLFRARELLRTRLTRRGLAPAAGLVTAATAPGAGAAVPTALAATTLRAAGLFAAGRAGAAAGTAAVLARGVLRTMLLTRLRTAAAVLGMLAVLGMAAGLAGQNAPSDPPADTTQEVASAAAAEPPPKPGPAKEQPDRPKVVQVTPADGASDVEPVTEIRIRFDRAMDPTCAVLDWGPRAPAGFRPRGDLRYDAASHEFILPVQLSPGHKHEITVNRPGHSGKEEDYEGFRSEGRVVAKPLRWSFRTVPPAAKDGPAPRVTGVSPATDTEVAVLTPLEVTFDRPMDPLAYGLAFPEAAGFDRRPELLGRPTYDADRNKFTLLVHLPLNWNGEVRLEGFRGKDDTPAPPATLKYRTLRTVLSEGQRKRVEEAGRASELKGLVEKVRKARRDLTSVSERATDVSCYGFGSPDWYQTFQTWGSRFQMKEGKKFLGVVDDIMGMPFRIGSDGTTCWFRRANERTSLAARDIEANLLFGDALDAFGPGDAGRVIAERKLEYLGEATVRGRRCHRVRSWSVGFVAADILAPVRDWFFDAETLLPVRVGMAGPGDRWIDYVHTRVNQPIPDEDFRPASAPGVKVVDPDPLTPGYTQRYLNVNDGSAGRMSVRWGMKGPKGSSSSGLN